MILVTGSNGFVGSHLCDVLSERGVRFRAAVRTAATASQIEVGDLDGHTDWHQALYGCTAVVHLAARVHVMSDSAENPLQAFRDVNVAGTLNLARQAVAAGVKRFVFVSSVKVNGESTASRPYSAVDRPAPRDAYGQSKLEAEIALHQLARETGLEVVVVRPPLVYGPGVKANFLKLVKLVQTGLPLPFGSTAAYRSLVSVDNLVDLLIVCVEHPNAAGEVFMVSDGQDVTLSDLVRAIGLALGKRVLLVPFPTTIIRTAAKFLGAAPMAERTLGALQVDITHTRERLNWKPISSVEMGIQKTVNHFLASKGEKHQ